MWAAQKMGPLDAGARIFQRPEMYHAPPPQAFGWLTQWAQRLLNAALTLSLIQAALTLTIHEDCIH